MKGAQAMTDWGTIREWVRRCWHAIKGLSCRFNKFLRTLGPLAVASALVILIITIITFRDEAAARRDEALARREEALLRSWQLIAALPQVAIVSRGYRANIGLARALEIVTREQKDLSNVNLKGGWAAGAELPDVEFRFADVSDATFSDADLTCANFSGANVAGIDLAGACLVYATLSTEDSRYRANFRGALFGGADISGADFTGAVNLSKEQLGKACADPSRPPKNLPDGITPPGPCTKPVRACSAESRRLNYTCRR